MTTLLTASVCALLVGAPGPAPSPAPASLQLTTSVTRAAPGVTPSLRLRLEGDLPPGAGPLRVGGVHTAPWVAPAPAPPPARALEADDRPAGAQPTRLVVEVPPGGVLDYRATLDTVFPEACRGGCETGSYLLWAAVRPRDGAPEGTRRRLPRMARARVVVAPVVVPAPPGAVRARLSAPAWESPDTVRFVVTLDNGSDQPIWVPRAERLAVGCHARVIGPDNTLLLDRHAVPGDGAPPWSEREGARLDPGASVDVTLRCGDLGTPPGSRVYLRVRLRTVGPFLPRRERRSAYLATPVLTPEVRVR